MLSVYLLYSCTVFQGRIHVHEMQFRRLERCTRVFVVGATGSWQLEERILLAWPDTFLLSVAEGHPRAVVFLGPGRPVENGLRAHSWSRQPAAALRESCAPATDRAHGNLGETPSRISRL